MQLASRQSIRGYTLVEVMIVASMIAIVMMGMRAAFLRVTARSQATVFWNDCRVFSEAFSRYAQEKGSYPADQTVASVVPAGMEDYLRSTSWLRTTPLGGTYEWDNKDAHNSLGVTFNAAVKVTGCTWTLDKLLLLDQWLDDGSLTTGSIRVTDAGSTVIFVIENAP